MHKSDLKEIPISQIPIEKFVSRDPSTYDMERYNIDFRYAQLIGDYPLLAKRAIRCWSYNPEKIIIEIDNGKLYLCEIGNIYVYEIRFFDDPSELTCTQWNRTFGYLLQEMIWRRRIARSILAEDVGISEAMLSKYIAGKAAPRIHTTERLARVLDCSIYDLLPIDFYLVRD